MAKLYFRYGAMGSSKTANALMVEYNYFERGKKALLLKPGLDNRDGDRVIKSRIGLSHECSLVEEFVEMSDSQIREYDCIIVDEAQFCKKSDIEFFLHVVDDLEIPVICYGLRTDFKRELFEGAKWLLAWADEIEGLRTVCWCGRGASCNARVSEDGSLIRDGEQVVLGGNDKYIALCRKHYRLGQIGATLTSVNQTTEKFSTPEVVHNDEKDSIIDNAIHPKLLEFLDASTYEEKLGIFKDMTEVLDDSMINTIAVAMDIEVEEGTIDRRIEEVMNCLVTLEKYECNRFR